MNRNTMLYAGGLIILALLIVALVMTTRTAGDTTDTPLPTLAVLESAAVVAESAQTDATAEPQPTIAPPTDQPLSTPNPAVTLPFERVQQEATPLPSEPVPHQVVIAFTSRSTPEEQQAYLAQIGATVVQTIDSLNVVVVNLPEQTAAQPLPPSPAVAASEPDYFVSALYDIPTSDPLYNQQWALPVIGLPQTWQALPADMPPVIVAVIDSGICASHPDLQGRVLPGWDFVENDADPQDIFDHGCGVAGIIAANIDDGLGMAGVAPNAQIMPLRVLDAQGMGTYSNVAAAIVYAVDHGAQIINLSLGGASPSSVLQNAVNYATARDVLLVAAGGNTGGAVLYPAAYAGVIAVASVDPDLQRSSFSSFGPQIDLLAPGRSIMTTSRNGAHKSMTGSSFAAPHVAGAAALEIGRGGQLALTGGLLYLTAELVAPTPPPPDDGDNAPTPDPIPVSLPSMRNPAAVYCTGLGHQYQTDSAADDGENGVCILPDGERCDQWAFYAGTCGQQHNYCASQGLGTITLDDGQDSFSPQYAACTDANGQVLGSVSDLSALATRALGCIGDDCPEIPAESLAQSIDPADDWVSSLAVPSSLDWRSYKGGNWMTPVRNQGMCGSCWAFAAVGAAEPAMKISAVNTSWNPDLAEQYLVSTCVNPSAGTCNGGSSDAALRFMRDSGIVDEGCMPYTQSDAMCSARCSNWASRLSYVGSTAHTYSPNAQYIKQNLVARGPVVVYMGIGGPSGSYFDGNGVMRCTNDFPSSGSHYIDHAVVAVGYNDAGGYWIIRNSWGSWWNGDGYMKVGYNECNIDRTFIAYAQQSIPAPTLQSPASNTTVTDSYVTFTWQGSGTPLQNAYHFRITTSANPNSGTPLVNVTRTSASYAHTFTTSGTYYWHVRTATDGGDTSGWVTRQIIVNIDSPPNDNFASARVIGSLPYTDNTINTRWATLQTGEPASCGSSEGRSVWYRFTPTYNDVVILSTQYSTYDTVLSVWTGSSLGNLTQVACNDMYHGYQSQVSFNAVAGTTYHIRVAGYGGSYGDLTLNGWGRAVQDGTGLVAAITQANNAGGGDIHLVPNRTYTLTGLGGQNGLPIIYTDIRIFGNGALIQRDSTAPDFRLFAISLSGSLYLENLTLSGGRAFNGGAIYNSGELWLNNVTLTQNHASSGGGAIYNTEYMSGYAVRFINNSASYGGGLYLWDMGTMAALYNSEFEGNSAQYGGALYLTDSAEAVISLSRLVNNTASETGGAVYNGWSGQFTLMSSLAQGNHAQYGGGLDNEGSAAIRHSSLVLNTAVHGGGGILNGGSLYLADSFVRSGEALFGGGLVSWTGATIERTTFADNTARADGGWGGAIYNTGNLSLRDSILNNNSGVYGGALGNYMGAVMILDSHFRYNHGKWGGAIWNYIPSAGTMSAQTLEAAGPDGQAAAISPPPAPPADIDTGLSAASTNMMILSKVIISHNNGSYGGGLYNFIGELYVHQTDLHKNFAYYEGGGLYNVLGILTLDAGAVRENVANFTGGGGVSYGTLLVGDTHFEENRTQLYSGGALANYGYLSTTGVNDQSGPAMFFRNHAEGSGGAIYNAGSADLDGMFLQNSAYYDGGAVMNYGYMTLGGQYASGRAGYNGGGIASVGGSLTIRYGTLIEYNQATYLGGGLYYQAASAESQLIFENPPIPNPDDPGERRLIFYHNSAGQGGGLYIKRSAGSALPVAINVAEIHANKAGSGGAIVAEIPLSISQSCISANNHTSVVSGEGALINAAGNWWGMANGPAGAGPGYGDSLSDNVTYSGFLTSAPAGCSPANDELDAPLAIPDLPFSFSQSVANATPGQPDPELSACLASWPAGYGDPYPFYGSSSVWYTYNAPRDGIVRFDTAGSDYNTMLSVWTQTTSGDLTPVACNDDAPGLGTASRLTFNVSGGVDYHLLVVDAHKPGTAEGGQQLHLNGILLPPENDDFAQAYAITAVPLTHRVNTVAATSEPSDPATSCAGPVARTVWYRYEAADHSTVHFSTVGSEYPTALSAWRLETGGGLSEMGCVMGSDATLEMVTAPGDTYYVLVGAEAGADGGSLVFTMAPPLRVPVLAGPDDGLHTANRQPTFTWGAVPGAVRYDLRLDITPDLTAQPYSVTSASYRPAAPLSIRAYYWQVRAVAADGRVSAWSAARQVTIVSPPDVAPQANRYGSPAITLYWGGLTWATGYEIQISDLPNFSRMIYTTVLPGDTLAVAVSLPGDGTYYWRVRARRANGAWGAWSATESFVIDIAGS